ncbi:MAG TPA: protein YgfX [Rhodocyclaceae bacterium]|nr:protein YgfX [Rhodocyclaceae bacterium]
MELPLRLQLRPSRSCFLLLTGGHILAGVAVCLLPLPPLAKAALLLALVVLGWRAWRTLAQRVPILLLRADGKVELLQRVVGPELAEIAEVAEVGDDTLVWPWLVVLHLRAEADARPLPPLLLFADSVDGRAAHRRLRLWLRWGRPTP